MRVVNLSRRPFVNDRPVVRLAVLLWVLGAVLLAVNIYSYTNYWIDSAEVRAELAEIETEIEREQKSFRDLQQRFQRLDLRAMNAQTAFLNGLIRDRTFPWSLLFEHLEEVLPFDVKLEAVRPELSKNETLSTLRGSTESRRPSRRRGSSRQGAPPPPAAPPPPPPQEEVNLSLQGTTKSGEALLDFVDALFAHPSFRAPNLLRESLNDQTGQISFEVKTLYLIEDPEDVPLIDPTTSVGDAGRAPGEAPEEIRVEPEAVEERSAAPAPGADADRADADRVTGAMASPPAPGARAPTAAPAVTRPSMARQPADGRPPTAGRSPTAGRPAAGRPVAGTTVIGPSAATPSPPPPAGARPSRPLRPSPAASAADGAGDAPDSRPRPRFVEPNASDSARLGGGSGSDLS